MPLLGQHREVRVVDRHQRLDEQRLGVLEVLAEHEADVVGGERHRASRKYAPSVGSVKRSSARLAVHCFGRGDPSDCPGAPPGAHRGPRRSAVASARSSDSAAEAVGAVHARRERRSR